jgi:DNA-binding NarL/FixJ family response regulator
LRHVRATHPETRVLMLSGLPERQYAVNGLRSAPADFCPRIASRKNCSRLCARS